MTNHRLVIAEILRHPFFWTDHQKLSFFKDASDLLEAEQPEAPAVVDLESLAPSVLGTEWNKLLHESLINNLGKYRKYDFTAVRDLLRVIRNKAHHFRDLEPEVQQMLGDLPSGYLRYFVTRFPKLMMHVYHVLLRHCREEEAMKIYFPQSIVSSPASSSHPAKKKPKPQKNNKKQ